MTKDYITVTLNVHLEGGDRFTTGFNILLSMLLNKSIQQFVDDYYVGSNYTFRNLNQPTDFADEPKKIEGIPINVPPPVFELRDLEPPSLLNSCKN